MTVTKLDGTGDQTIWNQVTPESSSPNSSNAPQKPEPSAPPTNEKRTEPMNEKEPNVKYRKRPLEVEAMQLTWANWSAISEFVKEPWLVAGCYLDAELNPLPEGETSDTAGMWLRTPVREVLVRQGDWIVRGIQGDYYPLSDTLFQLTYYVEE